MTNHEVIRVLIVDDHRVVRSGLAAFIQSFEDLELVGEAPDGEAALMLCVNLQPDVVLMDLVMPKMNGAVATARIREKCPGIQVIALTSFKEQDLVQRALQAGAIGYLLKNVSASALADAIRAANQGKLTLAPEAAQALIQATTQPDSAGYSLTERELEVLALMAEGLTNKLIADRLYLSYNTIKVHARNIYGKLNVNNRTQALTLAREIGFLPGGKRSALDPE